MTVTGSSRYHALVTSLRRFSWASETCSLYYFPYLNSTQGHVLENREENGIKETQKKQRNNEYAKRIY